MPRKITLTEDRLRDMIRKAYDDGHDDGRAGVYSVPTADPEDDWLESVTKSNLEDDIADYRETRRVK